MYMRVENGLPQGLPMHKPSLVSIVTAQGQREVGCGHWSDAELITLAGIHPVNIASYDPEYQVFSGGGVLDEATGIISPAMADRPLPMLKARELARIDAVAEAQRLAYITGGSGQAMVYQTKLVQGRAWLAAGEPGDLTAYPFIAGEIGINGATALEVVTLWIATEAAWMAVAAQIETVRLGAKASIAAAETAADIRAVMQSLVWP